MKNHLKKHKYCPPNQLQSLINWYERVTVFILCTFIFAYERKQNMA